MTTIWLSSDHHFGHANILGFTDPDAIPLRVHADIEEMNFRIVEAHNAVVKPNDHVYLLGDFAMKQQDVAWAKQLNGHKRLVRGNHDIYKTKTYLQAGFEEIYGVRVINDMILSHIPVHPDSINRRWLGNVHGHLHRGRVMRSHINENFTRVDEIDSRYLNVSMECLQYYTPITLEQAAQALKGQQA